MKELLSYLDINEVEYKNDLISIWENITKDSKLLIYTNKWWILKYYQDFLNQKITAEEFFLIWDVSSNVKLKSKTLIFEVIFEIYQDLLSHKIKKYKDSLIIVDKKSKSFFENKFPQKMDYVLLELEKINSKIFFL